MWMEGGERTARMRRGYGRFGERETGEWSAMEERWWLVWSWLGAAVEEVWSDVMFGDGEWWTEEYMAGGLDRRRVASLGSALG